MYSTYMYCIFMHFYVLQLYHACEMEDSKDDNDLFETVPELFKIYNYKTPNRSGIIIILI